MWKLENWQMNLQEGNWISRETNGRPCGWTEFIRCKVMQGSCHPPCIPVCKTGPYYLFIRGWEAGVPWSWCLLSKWMGSILSNDMFEMKVTSLSVTAFIISFLLIWIKQALSPPCPPWLLLFWVWLWWSLSFWEAVASITNPGKAEMSRGIWWGMERPDSNFNKEDSHLLKAQVSSVNLLLSLFFSLAPPSSVPLAQPLGSPLSHSPPFFSLHTVVTKNELPPCVLNF